MSEPLEPIRPATPEEIEKIKDHADLTANSSVLIFENNAGEPDIAVIRSVVELDPVFFGKDSSTRRKAAFIWGLQNILRNLGTREYYFMVDPANAEWTKLVKEWGAQETLEGPQMRFRKNL